MKNANKSVLIAAALAVALVLWIVSGMFGKAEDMATDITEQQAAQSESHRSVKVQSMVAEPVSREVIISARTDAAREVDIRAETQGRVESIAAKRGSFLKEGDLIAKIEDRDRLELLAQAKAVLKQREMEYTASKGLVEKGYQSETRTAENAAQLEIAKAELERILIDMDNTEIRAPFDGYLASRDIEVGDYLQEGDPVGLFIETNPLIVTGEVTEKDVLLIEEGMPGTAILPNGAELSGTVRFVAPIASKEIRTFPVEVIVENPGSKIPAGITAKLLIPTQTLDAHKVTPAVLSLNSKGDFGVKVVDSEDIVQFYPASVVKSGPDGIWLGGLPERIQLIVNGQGFVREGEQVESVIATAP